MTNTSSHDEEVEHFVGAEELMFRIEDRQLEGIDDTAHGVDDAAGQQPEKCGRGQGFQQRPEYQDTYPAHGNVDHRGKPLRTGDPTGFHDHAHSSNAPDKSQQRISQLTAQYNEAHRCVRTGNQYKDHHMIQLPEDPETFTGEVHGMISGAGTV